MTKEQRRRIIEQRRRDGVNALASPVDYHLGPSHPQWIARAGEFEVVFANYHRRSSRR